MRRQVTRKIKSHREQGFTIVNIAGMIVGAGAIFGVGVGGYDWVEAKQQVAFYHAVQNVENQIWAYRDEAGHWPGDCNRDAIIGFHPKNQARNVLPENASESTTCESSYQDEKFSTVLADLEKKSISGVDEIDSLLAGKINVSVGHGVVNDAAYNVIVFYGVDAPLAQWLDGEIDGVESGQLGRIRRWDVSDRGGSWPANHEQYVAVAYYFDKKAP